jgi:hypothetical protein
MNKKAEIAVRTARALGNPEKSDVQYSVHASNPGGAGERECIGSDCSVGRIVTVVSVERSLFNTSKNEEE